MNHSTAPVQLLGVTRSFGHGENTVVALDDVSVAFPAGTFTAVMGPSGSGKTTLLHCAAGLDEPTAGEVILAGTSLAGLSDARLTELRRDHVAFVFQALNLMPALSVYENVTLPAVLAGRSPDRAWATNVIGRVGLSERSDDRPGVLSGGQQQRVAIARAVAAHVDVLFADEPTGALDRRTGLDILGLLRRLAHAGTAVVMVTHDPIAAAEADQVLFLLDGRIVHRVVGPTVDEVTELLTTLPGPRQAERVVR